MAKKIDAVLNELTKDCDELAAQLKRGKMIGVQQGLEKARAAKDALQSLNQMLLK
jgi:hypothetical protein